MAMTIELKPCPFCGGEVQLDHPTDPRAKNITFILCDGCGAVTSFRPNLSGSKAAAAWSRRDCIYDAMADAITTHLTQPAQAVDVWMTEDGRVISERQKATAIRDGGASASSVAPYSIPLTRALSVQKAGPVGDDADAQWALRFKAAVNAIESEEDQPMTAACGLLLIDACVERKAKTVTLNFDGVEHKDGRDLGDWTVTVECRRKAPLPASPTPDKEGA